MAGRCSPGSNEQTYYIKVGRKKPDSLKCLQDQILEVHASCGVKAGKNERPRGDGPHEGFLICRIIKTCSE